MHKYTYMTQNRLIKSENRLKIFRAGDGYVYVHGAWWRGAAGGGGGRPGAGYMVVGGIRAGEKGG